MINGSLLRDAIVSAAYDIQNQKQKVDELNVFPVPDGDTGTNMSMTICASIKELMLLKNPTVEQTAKTTAAALLRGARGNSGVILSLLFRGFANGLKGKEEANGVDFANALTSGVESAYKAVMKPTEGTILTVARVAAEKGCEVAKTTDDALEVFEAIVNQAEITLNETPEMLPVLKKAGVVDAGGKGFTVIFSAMLRVFKGEEPVKPKEQVKAAPVKRTAVAQASDDIKFAYCTEYIVNKKKDSDNPLKLRAYLESIGDSVVVVDDEDIIKVHVHTNHPGNAIEEALKFGMLTNLKIENMKEQHSAQVLEADQLEEDDTYVPVDPEMPYGFVAVAAGEGVQALFQDLGVNNVVTGGQTMNGVVLNEKQYNHIKRLTSPLVFEKYRDGAWKKNTEWLLDPNDWDVRFISDDGTPMLTMESNLESYPAPPALVALVEYIMHIGTFENMGHRLF